MLSRKPLASLMPQGAVTAEAKGVRGEQLSCWHQVACNANTAWLTWPRWPTSAADVWPRPSRQPHAGPPETPGGRRGWSASPTTLARERMMQRRAERDAAAAAAARQHAAAAARERAEAEAGWRARRGSWAARAAALLRCEVRRAGSSAQRLVPGADRGVPVCRLLGAGPTALLCPALQASTLHIVGCQALGMDGQLCLGCAMAGCLGQCRAGCPSGSPVSLLFDSTAGACAGGGHRRARPQLRGRVRGRVERGGRAGARRRTLLPRRAAPAGHAVRALARFGVVPDLLLPAGLRALPTCSYPCVLLGAAPPPFWPPDAIML